jgi:hypothetical protein
MNITKEKGSKWLSILVTLMMLLATFSMLLITTTPVVFANITNPTVSVYPTTAGIVDADYTITFHVGPTGALKHGLSSIAILFPVDTAVAAGFIPGIVNGVVIVSSDGNSVSRIVQISTPVDVDDDGEVVVVLTAGITNPTTPDDYNLSVWTIVEMINVKSDNFTITGAADSMSVTVQPTETVAGIEITPAPAVTVVDVSDNPVEGVEVTISEVGGYIFDEGTLTQTTGPDGKAAFDDLVINTADIGYQLSFTTNAVGVDDVTSDTFNVTAATAAALTIEVQPSTAVAGVVITPAVQVKAVDSFGNGVAGLQVNATLQAGTGVLSGDVDKLTTAGTGIATFDDLSIDLIGVDKVLNFTSGSLFVTSNAFTIQAASVAVLTVEVQPSVAVAGVVIAPSVQVKAVDGFGNVVSGLSIAASLKTGTGVLSGTTTRATNATGFATFNDLSIDLIGVDKVLNFTSGSLFVTSDVFNIIASPVATLSVLVQPSTTVAGAAITPSVQVKAEDSFGNVVSGLSIAVSLKTGTGVLSGTTTRATNATGFATFNDLSIDLIGVDKVLNFTSGSLYVTSNVFTILASSVAVLTVEVQPSASVAGVVIVPSVQVKVVDTYGNVISGASVAVVLQTGTGVLSGTTPQSTNGTGIVTFDDLSINLIGVNKVLRFSSNGHSVDSAAFAITSESALDYAVMDADYNGKTYTCIDVYFNTNVDNSTIQTTDFNLSIPGVTVTSFYNDGNTHLVTLKLSDKLTGGGPTITIAGDEIDDLLGNPIPSATLTINTYRINLSDGWNMFSLPADVSSIGIPTLLTSIWSNVDRTTNILWYNASANTWKYYSVKTQSGTFTAIEPGKAYWIHMNASDTLIGNFSTVLHGTNPPPIVELTGHRWNMIGTWATYNQTANRNGGLNSLFDVLNDTGEILYKYTRSGGFVPIYGNSTIKMQPGDGFWLYLRTQYNGYYTLSEP